MERRIERLLTMDKVQLRATNFRGASPEELRSYYKVCLKTVEEATPGDWKSQKTAGKTRQYIEMALVRLDTERDKAVPALTSGVPYATLDGSIAFHDGACAILLG